MRKPRPGSRGSRSSHQSRTSSRGSTGVFWGDGASEARPSSTSSSLKLPNITTPLRVAEARARRNTARTRQTALDAAARTHAKELRKYDERWMYLMPLFRLLKTGDTATSPQKRREQAVANLEVAAHVATKLTPDQVERRARIKRLQASERVLIGAQIARGKAEVAAMDRRRGISEKVEATIAHAAAWGAGVGAATALKRAPLRKAMMVSSRGMPQKLSRFNTNSLLALFRTHAPLNRLTFDHFNSVLVTGVGVNGFDLERVSRPLFNAFAGGEDTVDYRPILCSLRPIDRPTDTVRQTLMWSFDCFDSEGTGYLSRDDIFRVCLAAATDGEGVEQIEAAVGAIFGGDSADLVAQQAVGYEVPETLVSRSMFEMLLAAHLELELLLRKQFLEVSLFCMYRYICGESFSQVEPPPPPNIFFSRR